jgi:poly(A) polymerase
MINKINNTLEKPVFRLISERADEIGTEAWVIGGFVRDLLLGRDSKDIDIVVAGSGIALAQSVARKLGKPDAVTVFKNFGTASLLYNVETQWSLEFVGARRESYRSDSRKPDVESGSLEDDQKRRDFTINALALSLNASNYGTLTDPFNGLDDLENGIIRTPLDPDITFSDDPLRMLRAVRFATQLGFVIEPVTFEAIKRNAVRLDIISRERIADELNKILSAKKPSTGFYLLYESGLMQQFLPEFIALKGTEYVGGRGHKDNFNHTLEVVDNIAMHTDNVWLRWAALLHDIAKPATKKFDTATGWTFYGHENLGTRMTTQIFKRLKLPLNEKLDYVKKLVNLHLRPIALVDEEVTESAIRRLLFDAGEEIEDLMLLCECDITSKNPEKVKRYLKNFEFVRERLKAVEENDRIRNFQPPVTGDTIMQTFNIQPSYAVGVIKSAIKEAVLDCTIDNNFEEAFRLMISEGMKLGLTPVGNPDELLHKFSLLQQEHPKD